MISEFEEKNGYKKLPIWELVKGLREDAEWADANIWEVPITLPDHLKQAADELEWTYTNMGWIGGK